MPKQTVWIAELSTEHFEWRAVGATEGAALAALKRGWNRLRREIPEMAPWSEYADGVNAYEIAFGDCHRDGWKI